jgi:hypothetical protein
VRKEQPNLIIIKAQLRAKWTPIKKPQDTPSINIAYKDAVGKTNRHSPSWRETHLCWQNRIKKPKGRKMQSEG